MGNPLRDEARAMSDDELFRGLVNKDYELEHPTGNPSVDEVTRYYHGILMDEFLSR